MRKGILGAVAMLALLCTPAAATAAGSPAVTAGSVTAIRDTAATLHGTVNPNGAATTYQFSWGPTTALGHLAPATAKSAGTGNKPVAKKIRIGGLTPDTTYYYELVATNSSGSSVTPMESFKTSGNPPPTATTGAATNVARDQATMTGTINPSNQTTTYYFRYGLSASYGLQTAAQTVPAGTAPVTVSYPVLGLAPGYTFHYQLVATHGTTATTVAGADAIFETQPFPRPVTPLTASLTPNSVGKAPYTFTANGSIGPLNGTPAALACQGTVRIRSYAGKKLLNTSTATVAPDCSYTVPVRVGRVPKKSKTKSGKAKLTVFAYYEGWLYGGPSKILQKSITVG